MRDRRNKFLFWMILFIVGGILLYLLNPTDYRLMPKCPIKLVFGIDCPGCGFQRAVHAMLHGRFLEAIQYNLFLVFGLPYLLAIVIGNMVLKGERQLRVLSFLEGRFMTSVYVVAFTCWFIVRNLYHI